MPCVQKCLSKLTGVPYRKAVDPDRAVAFGAALQARANDGEIAAEDDFVVVGAFQAEVLRHFAQANSVDDEDLGALEDEDGDFEAYLEDLDEVDDEEFERLLALAEEERSSWILMAMNLTRWVCSAPSAYPEGGVGRGRE